MNYSLNDNTMNTVTVTDKTYPYTAEFGSAGGLNWGGSGGAGQVLTTNSTGGFGWATISSDSGLKGKTLKVQGDADITGELTVQGVKLSDRLDKIDERLAILRPNEELEAKWENLRGLRKAYMELEAEIIEKERMWAILNK
jgi:hypothetical protein